MLETQLFDVSCVDHRLGGVSAEDRKCLLVVGAVSIGSLARHHQDPFDFVAVGERHQKQRLGPEGGPENGAALMARVRDDQRLVPLRDPRRERLARSRQGFQRRQLGAGECTRRGYGAQAAVGQRSIEACGIAFDEPPNLGHDRLGDRRFIAQLCQPEAEFVDAGKAIRERSNRLEESGILRGRGQLPGEARRQPEIAHRPGVGSAVDDDQHAERFARDPARHTRESDDALLLGDLADLFGDGIVRVVERDRDERAFGPALHDRLERRRHVAVEGLEDVAGQRSAGREDERMVGFLAPVACAVGHEDKLHRGQHFVEQALTRRPFGLGVE